MANRRMIYQDFFEDDYFGTKEYGMRLLWIGLIAAAADDQGRILDNTSLIRAKVFMYDDTPTDDVDRWLSILYEDNKIVRYSKDGKRLIQIVKWWDYQTPAWASHSKYPAPDGWIDRVRCHVTGPTQGGKVETINWNSTGGFHSEQPTEQRSKQGSSFSSGINDVNGDVNGDDDVKGKLGQESIERSSLLETFERETKIIQPSELIDAKGFVSWEKEVAKWETMGAEVEDVRDAIKKADEMKSNLSWPGSITKYMASSIARRVRGVNDTPTRARPTDPKSIAEHDEMVKSKLVEELLNAERNV